MISVISSWFGSGSGKGAGAAKHPTANVATSANATILSLVILYTEIDQLKNSINENDRFWVVFVTIDRFLSVILCVVSR